MHKNLFFSQLNTLQKEEYRNAIQEAFPEIILQSEITKKYWYKLEKYFPEKQLFIINKEEKIIGFINTIPIHLKQNEALSNNGWDWLVKKGIDDYENNLKANTLGGLQIIVTKNNQGKGYSKIIIQEIKKIVKENFENLIIPIRPIFKYKHPEIKMQDYLKLKKDSLIYDPWIRTHINCGAEIISVCSNSMNIQGNILFWENIIQEKIIKSGFYLAPGALNSINIDLEKKIGEYQEENIWISYPKN